MTPRIAHVYQPYPSIGSGTEFLVGCRACPSHPGGEAPILTVECGPGQALAAMAYASRLAAQHVSQLHETLLHLEAARKDLP